MSFQRLVISFVGSWLIRIFKFIQQASQVPMFIGQASNSSIHFLDGLRGNFPNSGISALKLPLVGFSPIVQPGSQSAISRRIY